MSTAIGTLKLNYLEDNALEAFFRFRRELVIPPNFEITIVRYAEHLGDKPGQSYTRIFRIKEWNSFTRIERLWTFTILAPDGDPYIEHLNVRLTCPNRRSVTVRFVPYIFRGRGNEGYYWSFMPAHLKESMCTEVFHALPKRRRISHLRNHWPDEYKK